MCKSFLDKINKLNEMRKAYTRNVDVDATHYSERLSSRLSTSTSMSIYWSSTYGCFEMLVKEDDCTGVKFLEKSGANFRGRFFFSFCLGKDEKESGNKWKWERERDRNNLKHM